MLTKMEKELANQEASIKATVAERKRQGEREVLAAEHLLKNVKASFRVQKEVLDTEQDKMVMEIQAILKNDELQWEQIKTQVSYRL